MKFCTDICVSQRMSPTVYCGLEHIQSVARERNSRGCESVNAMKRVFLHPFVFILYVLVFERIHEYVPNT